MTANVFDMPSNELLICFELTQVNFMHTYTGVYNLRLIENFSCAVFNILATFAKQYRGSSTYDVDPFLRRDVTRISFKSERHKYCTTRLKRSDCSFVIVIARNNVHHLRDANDAGQEAQNSCMKVLQFLITMIQFNSLDIILFYIFMECVRNLETA